MPSGTWKFHRNDAYKEYSEREKAIDDDQALGMSMTWTIVHLTFWVAMVPKRLGRAPFSTGKHLIKK